MKMTLLSMVVGSVLVLNGCSNTSEDTALNDKVKLSDHYYGSIVWDGEKYQLSQNLYIQKDSNYQSKNTNNELRFDLVTLEPGFETKRHECKKSPSHNNCEPWEDKEDEFIHVNFTSSDYGDTPSEKAAKRFKEQQEANKKLTSGEIATGIGAVVLSPFLAVGAVAGAAAGAVMLAPVAAVATVVDPDLTLTRNNWIEFDHIEFNEAVIAAIGNSQYGSQDVLVAKAENLDKKISALRPQIEKENNQLEQLRYQKMGELKKFYDSSSDVPKYGVKSYKFSERYPLELDISQFYESNSSDMADFYINERSRLERFYIGARKDAIVQYKIRQKSVFDDAKTEQDLIKFINKYQSNDMLSLVNNAKVKLSKVRLQHQKQQALEEQKRIAKAQALASWRDSVKPGDDTFCGPIIEIKGTMVHIALNAKLPGYSSESWLKKSDIFPANIGCINQNGNVYPQF